MMGVVSRCDGTMEEMPLIGQGESELDRLEISL